MKSNIKKHRESFGFPFFTIVIFSTFIWLLWLTTTNVQEGKRIPIKTKFLFSNIQFQENESYGSPLLFAKPSSKGFSADYHINLKDNSNIEFIPTQSPIFHKLDAEKLKTSTPNAENIVKKTIAPEILNKTNQRQPNHNLEKMVSLSKNLKELKFKIDTEKLNLNINKSRYAFYTVDINSDGVIDHIFVEKTNLSNEHIVELNKAMVSAEFDTPEKNEIGQIKFFFKNNE
jgi:hypothetical protein